MFKWLGRRSLDFAWAAVILLLPITSFPILSRLVGNTDVAPASLIPLAWLVLLWFAIYAFKKGILPRESITFLFFVSIALICSALAYYLNTPGFKGSSIFHEELKAVLTLLIGTAFYLVAATWLSISQKRLALTFKLISVGGAIMLGWGIIQAIFIFLFKSNYPNILLEFQSTISTRSLYLGRTTSFAFEPSWLAQELNLLYLPFWLSATISGWSAFQFRLWKVSLENILLLIGIVVLFLSSRIGTLSFILVLGFLGIYLNYHWAKHLRRLFLTRFSNFSSLSKRIINIVIGVILSLIFLGIYFLGVVALVFVISHVDWRLARFFQVSSLTEAKVLLSNVYTLSNYLVFAERFSYWVAGWNIFNAHPLFGVGLGNAGFYFPNTLPGYSWGLPNIVDIYYRATNIPNIKSFWIRLLAETGILGFSSFITWCYVIFKSAWFMKLHKTALFKMIGCFGLFVLIAFISEGFSTDTFALPYLWVSFGIVCAARTLLSGSMEKI